MDQRSDYLRQDIESTRASLDEKLDTLETKARQAFDLKHQVSERPWMALGAAVAAGYVLGSLGGEDEPRWHGQPVAASDYNRHDATSYNQHMNDSGSRQSRADSFLSQFDDEIDMLKMAAISTLTGFLRDTVREYVPALGQQLDKTLQDRGISPSGSSYTSHNRNLTPSTAPNNSMRAGAGRAGFDSPPETTYSSSDMAASAAEHAQPYYPPGSGGNADRDYVKTYHPPTETGRERTVGEDSGRR